MLRELPAAETEPEPTTLEPATLATLETVGAILARLPEKDERYWSPKMSEELGLAVRQGFGPDHLPLPEWVQALIAATTGGRYFLFEDQLHNGQRHPYEWHGLLVTNGSLLVRAVLVQARPGERLRTEPILVGYPTL
jgi:hypothetical protein